MKYIILIFFFITSVSMLHGQSTIAKIKYEQAEEAYNNGNLREALIKLDETEQLLGSINPKILYLRIMTQKLLLDKGNYSFGLLDSLRKNTVFYIKNYESNTAVEDKFREVFAVSEQLAKYPASLADYKKMLADKAAEEANKKMAIVKANAFIDSLARASGFLPGATLEELKVFNPKVAYSYQSKKEQKQNPVKDILYKVPHTLSWAFFPERNKLLYNYSATVEEFPAREQLSIFTKWKNFIKANVPAQWYENQQCMENAICIPPSDMVPVGIVVYVSSILNSGRVSLVFTTYEAYSIKK